MFADDIKLYVYCLAENYNYVCIERTEKDIDNDTLVHTSQSWGLKLNDSKCVVICFSPTRNCYMPYTGQSPYKIGYVFLKIVESHIVWSVNQEIISINLRTVNALGKILCANNIFSIYN